MSRADDMLLVRGSGTTSHHTLPLSTTGADGKAAIFQVVDEKGNTRFKIDSANAIAYVQVLAETVAASAFTDGGGAVGTYTMAGSIPAGAVILGSKIRVPAGFAGDVSAALTIGDGSDVDRYNTGTIDIFSTANDGVQSGVPSGNKLVTTANRPVLTVTSATDYTLVAAGGGSVAINIHYIATA